MKSSVNISKKRKVCEEKETHSVSKEDFQHQSNIQEKQSLESSQDSCDIKRVNTEPKAGTSGEAERKKKKKETSSMVTSSVSEEGFQHPLNPQKKQSGESSQHSCDIKRVNTEPKAGTSSAAEIILQPVCTKADYSHATTSISHSFDPESSSVNSEENANTQDDDAYASADSRDQIPLKTIDDALRQEYNLVRKNISSFNESYTTCSPPAAFYDDIDFVVFGIHETFTEFIRAFSRAPIHNQELLDGLDEHYSEDDINQVVAILITRVCTILYDMNKLLKVMEKEPFWTPLIKKGYDACCYDAGRSLRYKINDRIIRSTLTKWPEIKIRLSKLLEWLDKAVLLVLNVTENKDRMIFMKCVREMIVIVLENGGLREISDKFGDMIENYPSENIKFVLDVKSQLISIITRLISVVGYIKTLQEINKKQV